MDLFKLVGTIVINASGVDGVLDDTSSKTANFSDKVKQDFEKIAATAALVFSMDAVKNFAQACVDAYADIAANEAAFDQIMGDHAGVAQQKMEAVSEQTGVTSDRLLKHMISLTSRFKGLGYDVDTATTLAAEGLLMAADSAAAWDITFDDAMTHMNSFINGSYEGGEAIRLFATDTAMAQKAIEQGLIDEKKEWATLDEATKQYVRLNEIKRQLGEQGVTGQAERESGAYANQVQNLDSLWTRFKANVGEPITEIILLPIIEKLVNFLEWCKDNPDVLKEVFTDIAETIDDITSTAFDAILGLMKFILENRGALTSTLTAIGVAFAGIALATHPILTALAAITGFIMWIAGNYGEGHEEYIAGLEEQKLVAEANAGKYAHWTDAQKDAAMDYLYAADIQDNAWMADAVAAMKAAGLEQEAIDQYRADVSDALAEGDYYITIEDTWFDEQTEAQLQEQCDNMNPTVTVTAVPDYSQLFSTYDPSTMSTNYDSLQTWVDTEGAYLPGHSDKVEGFAKGLDYVPYDEFPAYLHKGEAVLTATEAAVWRNGGGMGDTSRLEGLMSQLLGVMNQVVANTGRGQSIVLDSGVLVGQIAGQMDIQLGTMASKKGRGIG